MVARGIENDEANLHSLQNGGYDSRHDCEEGPAAADAGVASLSFSAEAFATELSYCLECYFPLAALGIFFSFFTKESNKTHYISVRSRKRQH